MSLIDATGRRPGDVRGSPRTAVRTSNRSVLSPEDGTNSDADACGGTVIRIDALISCHVYLVGLVHILHEAGIAVVSARTTPAEKPSWLADAAVLDADALPPPDGLRYITEAARTTT